MEKFIIPAYYHGQTFTHGDLIKPKGGVIADAEKATGDMIGMVKLVSGCLASVMDINGESLTRKDQIEGVVRNMPYQTVEYLAMKIFANRSEGAIEQIIHCPRCKERYIYEFINEDIDNRIFFDDLEVLEYEESEEPVILIDLEEPVEIKSGGEVINTISNMALRFPNMNDGIAAEMTYPKDVARRQFQMYISAITHINGEETDQKFKKAWGIFVFDRMSSDDIQKIHNELKQYGVVKTKEHECSECGKQFKFTVDISGFFD